jgi:hypothetical protein
MFFLLDYHFSFTKHHLRDMQIGKYECFISPIMRSSNHAIVLKLLDTFCRKLNVLCLITKSCFIPAFSIPGNRYVGHVLDANPILFGLNGVHIL